MAGIEGNIVAEYSLPCGRVLICDAAFAGKSMAELAAVKSCAQKIAYGIAAGEARRQQAGLPPPERVITTYEKTT